MLGLKNVLINMTSQISEVMEKGATQRTLLKAQDKIFLSFLCKLFYILFDN